MDGMAFPVHTGLSGPAKPGQVALIHFTLQQIQRIGIKAGFMDGLFAKRLKDLDDEELAEKMKKILDGGFEALSQRSYELGRQIVFLKEQIDQKVDRINSTINKLESSPDKKAPGQIQKLKKQKTNLKRYKNDLDHKDRERRAAPDIPSLQKTETQVERIEDELERMADVDDRINFSFRSAFANKPKPDHGRDEPDTPDLDLDEA